MRHNHSLHFSSFKNDVSSVDALSTYMGSIQITYSFVRRIILMIRSELLLYSDKYLWFATVAWRFESGKKFLPYGRTFLFSVNNVFQPRIQLKKKKKPPKSTIPYAKLKVVHPDYSATEIEINYIALYLTRGSHRILNSFTFLAVVQLCRAKDTL